MAITIQQFSVLRKLVRHGNTGVAARALSKFSCGDLASCFLNLEPSEVARFIAVLAASPTGVDVLNRLPRYVVKRTLSHLTVGPVGLLLEGARAHQSTHLAKLLRQRQDELCAIASPTNEGNPARGSATMHTILALAGVASVLAAILLWL